MNWLASKRLALVSAFAVAAAGIVAYLPALRIGFLDGWWYLEWAAKFPFPRYLVQFLDPANITQGYRPVQGLYIYLLYHLFEFNPDGYHWAHNLLHAANGALLLLLIWRLGKRWRVAFIAALFYVTSPVSSLAVFWHAVVDPLAAFFYLLTMLLWCNYLESRRARDWAIAFAAYLFALFSKEVAFFLWGFLFLVEWWFYRVKLNWGQARLYAPFVVALIPYIFLVLSVQSHGEFTGQFGFRIGPHMLGNWMPYLAVLAFPWTTELPSGAINYIWLAVVVVAYSAAMVRKRSAAMLFLAIFAALNIAPLLGFPLEFFNTRYLYFSMMVSAIVIALLFELGWQSLGKRKWFAPVASVALAGLIAQNSFVVADAASGLAEYTRQLRVPFRDIAREHPAFPEDSYLYFVYSPRTPLVDLQGLFMTRYGLGLPVSGTEEATPPNLRAHRNTFVFYFDDANRPREIVVDRDARVSASPNLPADFDVLLRLESVEAVNPNVARGDPLIVLLSWRATGAVEKDYTIFAHLLDANNRALAQYDSPPRKGAAPTSQWKIAVPVLDAIVLPVSDVAAGSNYRLEIGLYDQTTMQRFSVLDARGQPITDKIVIEPIEIR
jgi:hypothetical protein